MYQPYLNNFEKAEERRTELLLENEHFSHFCINARKHPSCHNLGLMDYLIEPIQRIPRYKMLLQQIQKYSIKDPEPNDLYKKITEALENQISFNSPTSNKMYKYMNNAFSTFRTLIIEYLKNPNEQSLGDLKLGSVTAYETHGNNDELFKNYLFHPVSLWTGWTIHATQ